MFFDWLFFVCGCGCGFGTIEFKIMNKEPEVDLSELINHVHNYDLNPVTREIYLHSYYDSDDEGGVEYKMSTQFVKNLHLLDFLDNTNILVHLQAPGGDWSHGMAIFDTIEKVKSNVTILAHGEISSMSGILFQAADARVMMPHCEIMLHRGFLSLDGTITSVESNAKWNKKTDITMLEIYAKKAVKGEFFRKKKMNFKQTLEFIDDKIKNLGDWNLSAEDAVFYGLCDGIFGEKKFETIEKIRS